MPLVELAAFEARVETDLYKWDVPSLSLEYNEAVGKEKYFDVSPLEGAVVSAEKVDCMKLSNGVNQV